MESNGKKPVLFSGIQPTGQLMIGNYIGAIGNWLSLQDRYDCFFVLVDLHAITVKQDPADLLRRSRDLLALYLACGLDPDGNTIFVQSHVPDHAQLAWVLNCSATMGELGRMTQFKDKTRGDGAGVSAGLFDYPVLMAADILLYGTDLVPVGDDQKQHVELARDLAVRFNRVYGETFTVPEVYHPPVGARIMSLTDPTAKMSKSHENPNTYVALLDGPDVIRRKIRRAVTDSGGEIAADGLGPGIANLMAIYSAITAEPLGSLHARCVGRGYGQFKNDLAEALVEFLRPIQARYRTIREDGDGVMAILRRGAAAARERAEPMLREVHRALGFIPA